jgi:hypothetical protein
MQMRPYLLLATVLAFPTSISAQPAPVASERRLSPDEVERVLAEAAARREAAEAAQLDAKPPVYGEVGFGIGTGGYRSAYGTVGVPLDDGFASFSFSSDRARNRYTTHRNH